MVPNKVIYFTIKFLLFSILVFSKPPSTIAIRPLLKDQDQLEKTKTGFRNIEGFLKDRGFSGGALESSGPSSRGEGHKKFKSLPSLRTLKDSGPSPGVGHKAVAANLH